MKSFTGFLCFELGLAARKIYRYYNNRYSDYGITVPQSFILFALMEQDGQNVKDLAGRLSLDSPAITGLLDRLEKEDLVERRNDPGDRRALKVFLTEKGKKLAEEIFEIAANFNEVLSSAFDDRQKQALKKLITVIDSLDLQ
ncbi:MAG: MarR family transcriptional regulator [Peptococcaceae bacterium]|nr:MarR family transcriptional regulator [Peptococcaceae bacterium]